MTPHALEVRNVEKSFGTRKALAGIDLLVEPGESLGLLGPNGAGKSTLVRAIAGRVAPDRGEILVHGHTTGSEAARRLTGYVPQDLALYPLLTARENMSAFARYQGIRGAALDQAVDGALDWTALADRGSDTCRYLSGGMKRRLNIAAGTVHRPKLLLLDEPTVGVDPQSRERIYDMIGDLRKDGLTLLYTSHYMEEVERLCDRIAIIDHGRVIATGTREELVREILGTSQELTITSESWIQQELRDKLSLVGASMNIQINGTVARIRIKNAADEIADILSIYRSEGVPVRNLALKSPGLEAVFMALTGRELRE
ncbi:MAG TPA: ABC transporter ATP-binding protein [Thermoanaerobaculia bacterium]|jgi:ABC-2 type transport system ATP-binding protein